MSKQTFAERCQLAQQLLPDAQYRAMLTKLHAEMLAALAEQPAREWAGLDDTDLAVCDTDGVPVARYWERVLREKNT